MPEERKEQCETCKFWDKSEYPDDDGHPGQCRRYPPSLFNGSEEGDGPGAFWPWTNDFDWCGEWKPSRTLLPMADNHDLPVEVLFRNLSSQSMIHSICKKCFSTRSVITCGDLAQRTRLELLCGPNNLGPDSLAYLREQLAALGLKLKGD